MAGMELSAAISRAGALEPALAAEDTSSILVASYMCELDALMRRVRDPEMAKTFQSMVTEDLGDMPAWIARFAHQEAMQAPRTGRGRPAQHTVVPWKRDALIHTAINELKRVLMPDCPQLFHEAKVTRRRAHQSLFVKRKRASQRGPASSRTAKGGHTRAPKHTASPRSDDDDEDGLARRRGRRANSDSANEATNDSTSDSGEDGELDSDTDTEGSSYDRSASPTHHRSSRCTTRPGRSSSQRSRDDAERPSASSVARATKRGSRVEDLDKRPRGRNARKAKTPAAARPGAQALAPAPASKRSRLQSQSSSPPGGDSGTDYLMKERAAIEALTALSQPATTKKAPIMTPSDDASSLKGSSLPSSPPRTATAQVESTPDTASTGTRQQRSQAWESLGVRLETPATSATPKAPGPHESSTGSHNTDPRQPTAELMSPTSLTVADAQRPPLAATSHHHTTLDKVEPAKPATSSMTEPHIKVVSLSEQLARATSVRPPPGCHIIGSTPTRNGGVVNFYCGVAGQLHRPRMGPTRLSSVITAGLTPKPVPGSRTNPGRGVPPGVRAGASWGGAMPSDGEGVPAKTLQIPAAQDALLGSRFQIAHSANAMPAHLLTSSQAPSRLFTASLQGALPTSSFPSRYGSAHTYHPTTSAQDSAAPTWSSRASLGTQSTALHSSLHATTSGLGGSVALGSVIGGKSGLRMPTARDHIQPLYPSTSNWTTPNSSLTAASATTPDLSGVSRNGSTRVQAPSTRPKLAPTSESGLTVLPVMPTSNEGATRVVVVNGSQQSMSSQPDTTELPGRATPGRGSSLAYNRPFLSRWGMAAAPTTAGGKVSEGGVDGGGQGFADGPMPKATTSSSVPLSSAPTLRGTAANTVGCMAVPKPHSLTSKGRANPTDPVPLPVPIPLVPTLSHQASGH